MYYNNAYYYCIVTNACIFAIIITTAVTPVCIILIVGIYVRFFLFDSVMKYFSRFTYKLYKKHDELTSMNRCFIKNVLADFSGGKRGKNGGKRPPFPIQSPIYS